MMWDDGGTDDLFSQEEGEKNVLEHIFEFLLSSLCFWLYIYLLFTFAKSQEKEQTIWNSRKFVC